MIHDFRPDGSEKLKLTITDDYYWQMDRFNNEIWWNTNRILESWLSNASSEYNTSNYCVIHIQNDYINEKGDFYLQELRHEQQSGYMHYYYVVKKYQTFVEDSDKGKVSLPDAMFRGLKVIPYTIPSFTARAGHMTSQSFQVPDSSKYWIFGIVGSNYFQTVDANVFVNGAYVYQNGNGIITVVNQSSGNVTIDNPRIFVLVAEKGT